MGADHGTEAKDDVAAITAILNEAGVSLRYIHSDAALAGIPSAFQDPRPAFDIADGADSISISGHKFIGSPMPCGIVLTRDSLRQRVTHSGKYTGSADSTITGSRNGHTPLFMWYAIKRWGESGFKKRAQDGAALASYTLDAMQRAGYEAWRNPDALTVVFKTPPQAIVNKWQLATYDGWSHLLCMPGITKAQIDAFIADLTAR